MQSFWFTSTYSSAKKFILHNAHYFFYKHIISAQRVHKYVMFAAYILFLI